MILKVCFENLYDNLFFLSTGEKLLKRVRYFLFTVKKISANIAQIQREVFMLKVSHATMITISGAIWLAVGLMLLRIGVNLLLPPVNPEMEPFYLPLGESLAPYFGGLKGALLGLMLFALVIGYLKGRFVLGKSARKGVERILAFPNPVSIVQIYSPKYFILLAVMVLLGMAIKYSGLPNDIRGAIDVTIGIALLTGALIYFRYAGILRQN